MRIEDLDEFEGLTADMVRAWLRANGWELAGTEAHQYWRCGSDLVAEALLLTDLPWCIGHIANGHGLSPQSLLSEINPRMRPGWPTEEEIEAHEKRGGLWMASSAEDGLSFGSFCADRSRFAVKRAAGWGYRQDADAEVCFWPCDAHGNKVSRGTR